MQWVSASLGVGFNSASNFHNTPLIEEALNEHWQVGAGYEFADWGKSLLGRSSEQTLNTGFELDHLYTNGVIFNLTYVA